MEEKKAAVKKPPKAKASPNGRVKKSAPKKATKAKPAKKKRSN